ncbi:MAG: hypothetical protein HMLKMBBP_01350 [Planctomycetes bacterium]|nr:hypothetical protein [Planctomycetota bacterium]
MAGRDTPSTLRRRSLGEVTKYPISGYSVSTLREGIALVSVIGVLVILMMVATPFLISMRESARRGERQLYSDRVAMEADALFDQVTGHLAGGLEHVERRRLDQLGPGGGATGQSATPSDSTPTSDTPEEFALPASMAGELNQLSGNDHRVWGVEVRDAQGKLDLNRTSYLTLSNFLGRARLAEETDGGTDRIVIEAPVGSFPKSKGAIRIGTEVVTYESFDGTQFIGCNRGFMADKGENGAPSLHEKGKLVVNEAAFQIATRPFRARPGTWVRYTNVFETKAIADLGVTTLRPEQLDELRRYVTVYAGSVVGDGWSNPQTVRNAITAGDAGNSYLQVKNLRYFGVGTTVMITDGVNQDYGVVVDVRGSNEVQIAGELRFDYPADQTRVYALCRSPVNVNTADLDTLAAVFHGLKLRGRGVDIGADTAASLAQSLRTRKAEDGSVGVYRTWEDLVTGFEQARDGGILSGEQFEAVLRNALSPNDVFLEFSTAPLCFRSFDVYEVRATATALDVQGGELGRRELRRVLDVASNRSSTFVLETQADFQEQIRLSRDSKWFCTFPNNVNAYYDDVNLPASEYQSYANMDRFPSTGRAPTEGDFRLLPASFRFRGRTDRYQHFDREKAPDGIDLNDKAVSFSVDGPYDANQFKADLTDYENIPGKGDNFELGLRPFACSFWYKPDWTPDNAEHVIFDYGLNEPHMNRVSLRWDPSNSLLPPALVLAVADATREQQSAEVRYEFDQTTWDPETWYHIAVAVHGCAPDMLELFVDADKRGTSPLMTRLTSNLAPQGSGVQSISVKDARGFPATGVLLLHGQEGSELIEYSSHSDSSFVISRRKARSLDSNINPANEPNRTHNSGGSVQLYGYAAPLLTDVKRGGAVLQSNTGPLRAYRAHGADDGQFTLSDGSTTINIRSRGIAFADGYDPVVTLTEWSGGGAESSILDDIGPQGTVGYAMLVTRNVNLPAAAGLPSATVTAATYTLGSGGSSPGLTDGFVGGVNLVEYTVGTTSSAGVQVTLSSARQGLAFRHYDTSLHNPAPSSSLGGRFYPEYDYGYTNDPNTPNHPRGATYADFDGGYPFGGFPTAFIPVAIVGSGTNANYLDPADNEAQLGSNTAGGFAPGFAYVQIDGEWVKYDTADAALSTGRILFYRDMQFNDVANLWGNANLISELAAAGGQTAGQGGGAGTGTNSPPSAATDFAPAGTAGPQTPTSTSVITTEQPPPISMLQIAQQLDFRSWQDDAQQLQHRIANTIPAEHSANAQIIACFKTVFGNDWDITAGGRGSYPGFNDLVTLRDAAGHDEQIRLQWGYRGWAAPTAASIPANDWRWDRPTDADDLTQYPSQAWTRILKFPSGEMPDQQLTQGSENIRFGIKFDDSVKTGGMLDEIGFQEVRLPAADRRDYAHLGQVPSQIAHPSTATSGAPVTFVGITDKDTEIPLHWSFWNETARGVDVRGLPVPSDIYPVDGGLVRIGEELIFYEEADLGAGLLRGCQRGVMGTLPDSHGYGAFVVPIECFPMSRLTAAADESSATFELADASDFPDDGYLRVADAGEIAGYTEVQGNRLTGPLSRIDPGEDESSSGSGGARTGGALFRGRFGTVPVGYGEGDVAIAMPFRHWDRYSERSDDPENSYSQFSWSKRGAIWKRVSWDEEPRSLIEVVTLLRFQGGPAWDSDDVIRLGEQDMPKDDRRKHLYLLAKPEDLNLMNVESDRLEARVMVRFAKDAYNRFTSEKAPDAWKQTPAVRKISVEYVAPATVLSQE